MSDNEQEKCGIGSLAALILALAIIIAGLFWYGFNATDIPLWRDANKISDIGPEPALIQAAAQR
ncbi:hypothetical protein [Celeribacter sp.]|uniref:hypothetical protein n=1 Tax=Celeribacter sp. TaxID=1890673 RepID=UPI003A910161